MHGNKLALYIHLVWATWDRLPLIVPEIERPLDRCIEAEAREQGSTVLALNGVADHIHLLLAFPATISIADFVMRVKGTSSHFVNNRFPSAGFKWQGAYGAFTVSRWDVDRVKTYVERQKEHHAANDLWPEWEQVAEEQAWK